MLVIGGGKKREFNVVAKQQYWTEESQRAGFNISQNISDNVRKVLSPLFLCFGMKETRTHRHAVYED